MTDHDTFLERKNINKGIQPMKKDKMVVQKGNIPPPRTHTHNNNEQINKNKGEAEWEGRTDIIFFFFKADQKENKSSV